jgi:hypothetical protein
MDLAAAKVLRMKLGVILSPFRESQGFKLEGEVHLELLHVVVVVIGLGLIR